MSESSDADRFFTEAETYFYRLANGRNFGLALGTWKHPKYGRMLVRAVYGQVGRLYVTLVLCASEGWRRVGQARLWWYLNDYADPFEFRHIERRVPMAEVIINAESDLEEEIGARLRWLEGQTSIESAVNDIFGKAFSVLARAEEARGDPDNDLPTDDPEEGPA